MHPMWQQKELVDFCKTKGIHVTAYSPLGAISTSKRNNQTVASSLVEEIAKAHGKTSAQVSFPCVASEKKNYMSLQFLLL